MGKADADILDWGFLREKILLKAFRQMFANGSSGQSGKTTF